CHPGRAAASAWRDSGPRCPPVHSNGRTGTRRQFDSARRTGMGLAQIKMPQLGESVTEGTVDKWLKNEGDFVKRDEPLVEVVTDKVNAEIPSPYEGKLVKISAAQGDTVRVGAVIAQIEVAGAAGAAAAPAAEAPQAAPQVSQGADQAPGPEPKT